MKGGRSGGKGGQSRRYTYGCLVREVGGGGGVVAVLSVLRAVLRCVRATWEFDERHGRVHRSRQSSGPLRRIQ